MSWVKIGDFFGKKKKNGERRKNGVYLVNKEDGRKFTALNPSGKGAKYAQELKDGKRVLNDLETPKLNDKGKQMKLNKSQRAYRAGYLDARKDNAKAFNAKNGGINET